MILSVDPSRAGDGELAEGERERLARLAGRCSREDVMRAFDLLSKAEQDIRIASHPRYHFEMMLLRWMHLRKLVPLADVLEQLGSGSSASRRQPLDAPAPARAIEAPAFRAPASPPRTPAPVAARASAAPSAPRSVAPTAVTAVPASAATGRPPLSGPALKDALLAEIRAGKGLLYNTVVAQAQKIEVVDDRIIFTFLPTHRAMREQLEQGRPWLEATAERIAGRKISVMAVQATSPSVASTAQAPDAEGAAPSAGAAADVAQKRDLKAEAMSSSAVQAMLDVFPVEIRDIEEM
jgi:DNA polymerase-3 subunit gamma/tau